MEESNSNNNIAFDIRSKLSGTFDALKKTSDSSQNIFRASYKTL